MPKTVRDGRGALLPEPTAADMYCQRSFREPIRKSTSLSRLPHINNSKQVIQHENTYKIESNKNSRGGSQFSVEFNRDIERMGQTILKGIAPPRSRNNSRNSLKKPFSKPEKHL